MGYGLFDFRPSRHAAALGLALAGLMAGLTPASAAVNATLAFTQPMGIVTQTDAIPIYLRLTLADDSDPIATDAAGALITPLFDDAQIAGFSGTRADGTTVFGDPTQPYSEYINVYFGCSGTFTNGCGGGAYQFDFNYDSATGSLVSPQNLTLNAGDQYDYLFGTFTPTGGSAPTGAYTFYNTGVIQAFYQQFADPTASDPDNVVRIYGSNTLAFTCNDGDPSCAFTRLVTPSAVPEPAAWALTIGGFGVVGGALRRRVARGALRMA